MKKLVSKLRRKPASEDDGRITTESIAEHRERILAGGRRFKYPIQYARHRLVFNAIIIAVTAVTLLIVVVWWQLYLVQNTSDFMYRVTRVVPVPVASIDGQSVRYSDYLMKYRSSIHYLEEKERVNLSTDDGKRQSDFVKSQAMEDALADAFATKIAKDRNLSVSAVELETFLKQQRTSSDGTVSEATYDAVILDYYGWSPDEYRHAMETKLLRQKVALDIDVDAAETSETVGNLIKKGNTNLKDVTKKANKNSPAQVTFGSLGWVPRTNQDGGLAVAAVGLKIGHVSDVIKSTTGDGYYYVKLIGLNAEQVNYQYVHVPLTTFSKLLNEAEGSSEKVQKYITIPEVKTQQQ